MKAKIKTFLKIRKNKLVNQNQINLFKLSIIFQIFKIFSPLMIIVFKHFNYLKNLIINKNKSYNNSKREFLQNKSKQKTKIRILIKKQSIKVLAASLKLKNEKVLIIVKMNNSFKMMKNF